MYSVFMVCKFNYIIIGYMNKFFQELLYGIYIVRICKIKVLYRVIRQLVELNYDLD